MSIGRVVLGAQLLVAPGLVAPLWLGRRGKTPAARLLLRALGARDLGIGIGVLAALRSGAALQPWLVAGILADATDLAATLNERDELPGTAAPLVGPLAAGGVVAGLYGLLGSAGRAPVPA